MNEYLGQLIAYIGIVIEGNIRSFDLLYLKMGGGWLWTSGVVYWGFSEFENPFCTF
jgi:hypothetical protein